MNLPAFLNPPSAHDPDSLTHSPLSPGHTAPPPRAPDALSCRSNLFSPNHSSALSQRHPAPTLGLPTEFLATSLSLH
ncbi:hypothetical protein M404DRAFT_998319 [Pisolithus tinctorius Marx 270]|uniref:Uncharacterized protein n=1 Tax=Pisolithus tinctorius Marx 270 TaxID=870435 RepID=A0A0C3PF70_PISTI|nr:hypothetical protein M404DRAFT_998319 [Pisolithus tinctorius Marx 270]